MDWINLISQLLVSDVISLGVFMGLTLLGIRFRWFDIWTAIILVNGFLIVFAIRLAFVIESIHL